MSIMAYSPDLRKRVLGFIETGGKKSEAARRFTVARSTIDRWLAADDPLTIKKPGPKKNESDQRGGTQKTCHRLPGLDI